MITIESNGKQLARRIRRAISEMAQDPFQRQEVYRRIMHEGTSNHFRRLGGGGGDASALGTSPNWSRHRSPKTLAARDDGGFPLLRDTGSMMTAWTTGARVRSRLLGGASAQFPGSRISFTAAPGRERRKGIANQFGLYSIPGPTHLTDKYGGPMPLWPRQFLYWDNYMASEVKRRLRQAWETNA